MKIDGARPSAAQVVGGGRVRRVACGIKSGTMTRTFSALLGGIPAQRTARVRAAGPESLQRLATAKCKLEL